MHDKVNNSMAPISWMVSTSKNLYVIYIKIKNTQEQYTIWPSFHMFTQVDTQ